MAALGTINTTSEVVEDLKPYCVTGSGVDITATAATMDLSTEQVTDGNYSLSSDEVTITDAGTYLFCWSILIDEDGTAGNTRGRTDAWLEDDTVKITQSECGVYTRELSGGTGLSNTCVATIGASSVIRLRAQQTTGGGVVDISQDISQLSIIKLK